MNTFFKAFSDEKKRYDFKPKYKCFNNPQTHSAISTLLAWENAFKLFLVPHFNSEKLASKSPEVPGTHLFNLRNMKGLADLGATECFATLDPWIQYPNH